MNPEILVKRETKQIIIVTLNCPEKRNALSIAMAKALVEELKRSEKDPEVRIMIFQGAGSAFCAGLDLDEVSDQEKAASLTDIASLLFKKIYTSSLITIALAHGAAIGGGGGLLSACDFAIGTEDLKLGFPEVRRGIVPSIISAMLSRQMGARQLKELFLIGNNITGVEAASRGVINAVTSEEKLFEYGMQIAKEVLKGAPETISLTKGLLNRMYSENFDAEIEYARGLHEESRSNGEALEGISAFYEKRKPSWEPAT